jgi:signal transduction histidine kinase
VRPNGSLGPLQWAWAEGIAHVTIPLKARGQHFGAINLLVSEGAVAAQDDVEMLTTIGVEISEAVANAWLHAKLVEKEAARQALLSALVRAQEEERARLARELHDGAGQTLTGLLVRLKTLENAPPEHVQSGVVELCQSVSATIDQVREISYRLRPAVLEEFGLEVALQTLVRDMAQEAGLSADCRVDLNGRHIQFEVETAIYRITQEGLTNIVRHAEASHVAVELAVLHKAIALRIDDNGRGFDTDTLKYRNGKRRLGLLGIQERAEMLGGSMAIFSAPAQGTSVHVCIPLHGEDA